MSFFHPYISYFAQVDFRDDNRIFGLLQEDRMAGGLYLIGKTGSGKSNLMECLIHQDVAYGRGFCLLDIHGDLVEHIASAVPEKRKSDLIYLNTSNPDIEWGYNPLRKVAPQYRHLVASHLIESFEKIWGSQSWGTRIAHILRNSILTLLEQEKSTLADIPRLLTDDEYRNNCIKRLDSKQLKSFWEEQFPKYSKGDILPVLSKIESFMMSPALRKILVENNQQLSLDRVINEGKILLVNLSKSMLGVDSAHLLGSLLLSSIASAGFHRGRFPQQERNPFYLYIDEFHNYTTLSLVNMFSELRKYQVGGFVIAHQYLNQLAPAIRDAVLGNITNMVVFRTSYQDAKYLANELYPTFSAHDIASLENFHCFVRMMIQGKPSKPFSAKTLPAEVFRNLN